ncbi:amidohydrolase family protein [Fodinicola feengrottensis]|uniref:amidohydrolase family protein n=1 Tax=Fodinicola feengrottensis TaxID=435914 RepID=UPI0013D78838|nr:amidohydrolase family protein [Fodinicola feengrottensis]
MLRELERARLLDYDLIKNYVRLPVASQRQTIEWAHRRGIRASSHYLHPAITLGVDGMEHVGATNRLGYSQTVSRNGISYQDVISLFTAAGMPMTPTLFYSYALYATDSSLFTDRRVRALYPPWEYAKLAAAVALAKTADADGATAALRGWTATVTAILRGGGRIVAGTDSPIDNFGVSLHTNLRAMVHPGGLTPAEALRTATSQAADYLAVPDLGRITPGALADLTVLDGNPLDRIEDAANVRLIMLGGVPHSVDDLVSYVPPTPPTTAAAPTAVPAHPSQAAFWWHTEDFVKHAALCCSAPH